VWNFGRGDGLEKALCLVNILKSRRPGDLVSLDGDGKKIVVRSDGNEYVFTSEKDLELPVESDF
jgi:hypothetical protein